MARERTDVVRPLAQRRQAQAHDVEAMQEVLAEQSLAHALLQVLVRGRDDAHVGAQRRVAADAVVLAVRQHAQEAHLQVGGHVADLVEEQRAALGLLEAPAAQRLRAGERAALVAEELGLERSFGIAAVLIATNGIGARGLCRCNARATSSLPVPDSPVIITVVFDCDRRPIARNTSCIAGAWPRISGVSAVAAGAAAATGVSFVARRISASA